MAKCSSNASCGEGYTCDTASGSCRAPSGCTGANFTQSTCTYGDICSSGQCIKPSACTVVSNQPLVSSGYSPVIFNVSQTGTRRLDASETGVDCASIIKFSAGYYDPQGDVSSSGSYSSVKTVTASGTLLDTWHYVTFTSTGFTFEICGDVRSNQLGVVLKDSAGNISNVACLP